MVTIGSLWIPILVSAIIVWFASFLGLGRPAAP